MMTKQEFMRSSQLTSLRVSDGSTIS